MFFSIIITITFTLLSPFFYNLFNYSIENEVNEFSKYLIDSFWSEGWLFFEYWKVRILGSLGIFVYILLFFIEINSKMIQDFIIHTMISSAIVDYIYKLKEVKNETEPKTRVLSSMNMIESYSPDKLD